MPILKSAPTAATGSPSMTMKECSGNLPRGGLLTLEFGTFVDGQPTVYIRWTMGPTDSNLNFCGWNIDDVEIWAVSSAPPCPDCSGPVVENVTFPSNKNCECISSTSITMGTGIIFETGANVTVKAPTVILRPGFHAPSNARLNIRQP